MGKLYTALNSYFVDRMHRQDADSDIKTHQKQVDTLRDVARILREELVAGLSHLLIAYLEYTKARDNSQRHQMCLSKTCRAKTWGYGGQTMSHSARGCKKGHRNRTIGQSDLAKAALNANSVPILYDGLNFSPLSHPLTIGGSGPPSNTMSLGSLFPKSLHPEHDLDLFGHFCTAHPRDRLTDQATRSSVTMSLGLKF